MTHILINGMWVADNSASTAAVDEQAPAPAAAGKRVWVVKVVRREAIVSRLLPDLPLGLRVGAARCQLVRMVFPDRTVTSSYTRKKHS